MDYMDKVEQSLRDTLWQAALGLREARPNLVGDPAAALEKIASQVSQPCVVAVVGQVKSGKSSFINALLRDNLAKVGTQETTATINYFCYSPYPPSADQLVRCFYRDGTSRYVDRAFLDSLQGNDIETLRHASEIDRLEYYLHDRYLERITLVDTPGTGAAVDEHQNVTAEFMRLNRQLRDRHDQKTRELEDTADAIIYLVEMVAGSADQKFLEQFHELTRDQSQAFNAVGIMSKIDQYPEIIERRKELSEKIGSQLSAYLNTVVPVSAGLRRGLDGLLQDNRTGLRHLVEALATIAPGKAGKFLSNSQLYLRADPDWPLPVEQRKALLAGMPWKVFTAIARTAITPGSGLTEISKQLDEIAGFDYLREVLETHIFQRSRLLRCYSKVNQARKILNDLHYLPERDKRDSEGQEKLGRFLLFVQQARRAGASSVIAQDLEAFLQRSLSPQLEPLDAVLDRLDWGLAAIFHDLKEYNEDFVALQKARKHETAFSPAEMEEIQAVLSTNENETDRYSLQYVKGRQQVWRRISMRDSDPVRQEVANRIVARYGFIQEEIAGG